MAPGLQLRIHGRIPVTGEFASLLRDFNPFQIFHGNFFSILFRHLAHPDWCQCAVFQYRKMREQIKVLEHHANFAADLVDLLHIIGKLNAINSDLALLMLFKPIDAPDQG